MGYQKSIFGTPSPALMQCPYAASHSSTLECLFACPARAPLRSRNRMDRYSCAAAQSSPLRRSFHVGFSPTSIASRLPDLRGLTLGVVGRGYSSLESGRRVSARSQLEETLEKPPQRTDTSHDHACC